MQPPPYPPYQQPSVLPPNQPAPYGYIPPKSPRPNPVVLWLCIAVFAGLVLVTAWKTVEALITPSPQVRAYGVYHFNMKEQSRFLASKTFEAQGFLHIFYDCDYEVNFDGADVTFEIKRENGTVIWSKSVDCPVTDGAGISVTSGSYIASVVALGDVNWSFSVYQTL